MPNKTIFTATEARQHFFDLLRMAEEGKEPIVIKKDTDSEFKIIRNVFKRKDKMKIVKEMGRIGLKTLPMKQMKKILASTHEIKL